MHDIKLSALQYQLRNINNIYHRHLHLNHFSSQKLSNNFAILKLKLDYEFYQFFDSVVYCDSISLPKHPKQKLGSFFI